MPVPNITDKELKIVLSYLKGEKSARQIAFETKKNYPAVYDWIGSRTMRAIRSGQITISLKQDV